jgi:hypothetical protein
MRTTFVLALLLATSDLALAQDPPAPTLKGVWGVTSQQRDCATDANIGAPFRSLITYEDGGTLIESPDAHGFQTGQRSIGHGNWSRAGRKFVSHTLTMILFDNPPGTPAFSPGFQAGWQETNHVVRLTGPNSFVATGGAEFFDLNRQLYRTACAVRTGERFR